MPRGLVRGREAGGGRPPEKGNPNYERSESEEETEMTRACWVLLLVVAVLAVLAGSMLYGQAGEQAPAPAAGAAAAPAGQPGMAAMSPERMKAMVDRLELGPEDRAAVEKSLPALLKARQSLQDELGKLRTVAYDPNATPEQLTAAVEKYQTARADSRRATRPELRTLTDALSPRGRARCLVAGILDNGLGLGGGMRFGGRGAGGGGPAPVSPAQ